MRIRLRGPEGVSTLEITEDSNISNLRNAIADRIGIPIFELKRGYPPEPFDLDHFPDSLPLRDTGVKLNGEQFIVSAKTSTGSLSQTSSTSGTVSKSTQPKSEATKQPRQPLATSVTAMPNPDDPPEVPMPTYSATMVLRIMPDDNSCLFRAFSSAALGTDLDSMFELRSLVASHILENPTFYNAAVLDKPPEQYCRWIQTESSWGGAIELDILAKHFGLEVASINVQDGRVDTFNQGAEKRCVLVYSGIHYDVVALTPQDRLGFGRQSDPKEDIKVFDSEDVVVLTGALELCEQLRQRHYYTDTAGFAIQCATCGWTGNGEKAATEHASQTGHYNLVEVT